MRRFFYLLLLLAGSRYCLADNQVYIWQRIWNAQHEQALRQSQPLFTTLRVLGLQIHPREGLRVARVDTQLLQKDGRPVWLVIRLDGSLRHLESNGILAQIKRVSDDWQAAGVNLTGVEIDYDAPTSRLAEYRQLLINIRQSLPSGFTLSITALPDWLHSPVLSELLASVDSSVLQLHSVLSPEKGLFDPQLAKQWSKQYSLIAPRPFYLALPAYGSALVMASGNSSVVESESRLGIVGSMRELSVSPTQIATFIRQLDDIALKRFAGIVWFRLPLESDRRAWSLSTLAAVIHQQPLTVKWQWIALAEKDNAVSDSVLYELAIKNAGNIDGLMPTRITLRSADCLAADGAGNYRFSDQTFYVTDLVPLRAGQTHTIGWARCPASPQGEFHVSP